MLIRAVVLLLVVIWVPAPALADIVHLPDGTRIYGRIGAQTDKQLEFKQRLESGAWIDKVFSRDQFVAVVRTVDEQKLAALAHGKWSMYRDLADELSAQHTDPVANDMAIRLYLIGAFHARGDLRNSCLSGLIAAARNATEERHFRGLAYLSDSQHRQSWLDDSQIRREPHAPRSTKAWEKLRQALADMRSNRLPAAEAILRDRETQLLIDQNFLDICSGRDLHSWSLKNQLDWAQLADVIEMDLRIATSNISRNAGPSIASTDWRRQIRFNQQAVLYPTFENVTEFDPRQSINRGGKWVVAEVLPASSGTNSDR